MLDKVVIACYKNDFWLAEICCSSIRYWYPEIPIALIYDYSAGASDFKRLQKRFGVSLIELPYKKFGWGLSKIEFLFQPKRERVLLLDADTVFLGKVLDYLDNFKEDFVVSADWHNEPHAQWMKECYFDYAALQSMDRFFEFPGYSFNTGQLVVTTGILQRSDFGNLIQWQEHPVINHQHIFSCVDQGLLNYVLPAAEKKQLITIGKADFLMGINYKEVSEISIDNLRTKKMQTPKVLHWAGSNTSAIHFMQRRDILELISKV